MEKRYWIIAVVVVGVLSILLNIVLAGMLLRRDDAQAGVQPSESTHPSGTETTVSPDGGFAAALEAADLNGYVQDIEKLDMYQGQEFRVFQGTTKDGKPVLARAEKKEDGLWEIVTVKTLPREKGRMEMSWVKDAGERRYSRWDKAVQEKEWHYVYYGNDAVKAVELRPEQLPKNTAVSIRQEGEIYLVHVVIYGEAGFLLSIGEALEENGCVEPLS